MSATQLIDEIERLKSNIDCRVEIGRSITLKRSGKSHLGLCPFHADTNPSLVVYKDHYHCYACAAHGDLFDWLRHNRGLNHAAAVRYLGGDITLGEARPDQFRERLRRASLHAAEVDAERKAQRTQAQLLAQKITPIRGTLAATYLASRGMGSADWPACIGWRPWHGPKTLIEDTPEGPVEHRIAYAGTMLAVATLPDGTVSAVQQTFIDPAGGNVREVNKSRRNLRRTVGTFGGRVAVRLPGDPSKPLIVCEGLETGLSLWLATGWEVWVALGSTAELILPTDRIVIVARDDDPQTTRPTDAYHRMNAAMVRWRHHGVDVVAAWPWPERRGDKSDFNDVMRKEGAEAVSVRIDAAMADWDLKNGPPRVAVPHSDPVIGTADLTDAVELPIIAWAQQATVRADERLAAQKIAAQQKGNKARQNSHPIPEGQQGLAMSGVGSGKTEAALKAAWETLNTPVAKGNPPRRVIVNVQDHTLAENLKKRADKMMGNDPKPTQIYLGYNRPNPDAPETKQCLRADEMDAVTSAGGSMATLCGNRDLYCEFHAKNPSVKTPCGYTTTDVIPSGLLIMAGPETLKQAPPGSFKREINFYNPQTNRTNKQTVDVADLIIIDEPKTIALIGPAKEDGTAYDVSVRELAVPLKMFGPRPEDMTEDDVKAASDMVAGNLTALDDYLKTLAGGPLTRAACIRSIARTNWPDVRRNVFSFKVKLEDYIKPSMRGDVLKAELARLSRHNGKVMQIERLCRCLIDAAHAIADYPDDALSGLVELRHVPAHGCKPEARVLLLRWIVPVHRAWMGPPVLQLDAEAKPDVMRKWWRHLEVLTTARLPTSNAVYRRQVYDSAFPYVSIAPKDPTTPPKLGERAKNRSENTRWNNCRWLLRFITDKLNRYRGEAKKGDDDVLVIAPQRTEQALKALWAQLGGLPERLGIVHFQNFAGLNQYADVRYMCIVGRPQPPTEIYEAMAWAISGVRGESVPEKQQLPEVAGAYLMRDGTARRAKVRQHPDPMAELIRTILVTNQLIQGEGRGRGIWRGDDNPLFVDHLCDVPLPLLVDELVTKEQIKLEGSTARWLLASGLCPQPEERGFYPFIAAVRGDTPKAMEHRAQTDPDWLNSFRQPTTMPTFQVKPPGARYAIPVNVDAHTVDEAKAKLASIGLAEAAVIAPPTPKPPGTVIHRMAGHNLILFSPKDAAGMYPGLFLHRDGTTGSVDNAKKAIKRSGFDAPKFGDKIALTPPVLLSEIISLLGRLGGLSDDLSPNWRGMFYRVAGEGQNGAFALVRASRIDTIRAEMEAKLGPLEVFEIMPDEPPTPEPPEPPPAILTFPPALVPTHKRPLWAPLRLPQAPPPLHIVPTPQTPPQVATGPP